MFNYNYCFKVFVIFSLIIQRIKSENNLVNQKVKSVLQLKHSLLLVLEDITFYNNGPEPATNYQYSIQKSEIYTVTYFNNYGMVLKYTKINNNLINVILDRNVYQNETYQLFCHLSLARRIVSAEKTRQMNENQIVKFSGNLYFWSVYRTESLQLHYFFNTESLIEITHHPHSVMNNQIVFLFENVSAFAYKELDIFYVNNEPFLVIENYERTIEVSHFGEIFIEDHVYLKNIGAKIIGHYDSTPSIIEKKAAAHWLFTHLPASARDLKFFDDLGNSSRTKILYYDDYITLKFTPRYKLLGGWKTNYFLQYKVPIYEYLYKNPKNDFNYMLKIRGIDHVLNNVIIENVIVKVTLPEGAVIKNYDATDGLSYKMEEVSWTSGLNLFGQPTIVFNSSNVILQHSLVTIDYDFHPVYLLRAPFTLICYVEFVFVLMIVYNYMCF